MSVHNLSWRPYRIINLKWVISEIEMIVMWYSRILTIMISCKHWLLISPLPLSLDISIVNSKKHFTTDCGGLFILIWTSLTTLNLAACLNDRTRATHTVITILFTRTSSFTLSSLFLTSMRRNLT